MLRFAFFILLFSVASGIHAVSPNSDFDNIYRLYRNTDSPTLAAKGRSYISRQITDSALAVFTILANRYDADTDADNRKYATEARLSLGVINFLNSNYAAAYSNFLTATQLEGRADSPGHLNLAAVYLYFGDKRRAYQCLRDVFDAAIKSRNGYMASNAIINILTDDIDSVTLPASERKHLIMTFKQKVPPTKTDKTWPLASHIASASLASLQSNPRKAISELKLALPAAATTLIPDRTFFLIYVELGRKYVEVGRTDSAEFYLKKAHDIAHSKGFTELLISIYTDLGNFYAAAGRPDLAYEYRYKHLQLADSIFDVKEFGKIHDLELFHQTDKLEKRINRMSMEEKMRTKVLIITCVAILMLSTLLILLFRQNGSLRRKNKALFYRNLEIVAAEKAAAEKDRIADKKYTKSTLSDSTRRDLVENINSVMSDESVFCCEGFSLRELAELCGSNQKYVSQVLNEDLGKSFTQLVNERRVNVARIRLLDRKNYGHLTIEAIVADLGFKSRSTFSKTFKRITGLSPSEFQRMAADEQPATADDDS